jgi:hypothetical protein
MTDNQWFTCFGLASPRLLVALLSNRWPINWVPSERTHHHRSWLICL